jgi:hypothetical protein
MQKHGIDQRGELRGLLRVGPGSGVRQASVRVGVDDVASVCTFIVV